MTNLPQRKHPLHLPPRRRFNRPEIQFVTITSAGRRPILTRRDIYAAIIDCWKNPDNH